MTQIHSFFTKFFRRLKTFSLTTPVAIILAALILGGSHILYGIVAGNNTPKTQAAMFAGKPIDEKDYVEGNSKSDIFVVEYSDPECPYCVTIHPTLKQIRNEYGDRVGFVYRHFPLTQIHPNAYDESKAIACAGSLGGTTKFYEYVDALYGYKSNGQTTQLPSTGKEDIAGTVGLNKADFAACMKEEKTGLAIDASLQDGAQAGVQGTPSSFVLQKTKKGYTVIAAVDGARPYEYIQAAIEEALSR